METVEFAKFVASQQGTETNWAGIRDEWLSDLDALHLKIVGFLNEFTTDGSISYDFTPIELTEQDIGTYRAKRMDIRIGKQRVSLVPVGTLLVGCKGRVDAVGSADRRLILLVNESARTAADLIKVTVKINGSVPASSPPPDVPISWAWKIVTNGARKEFGDLNKKSFFDLLAEIANG